MQSGLLKVGLLSALLAGTALLAQHAGPAAAAPHMSAGFHGSATSPGPSRSFAPPAGLSTNHSSQVGRTGHWPSWNGANTYRGPVRQRYPYVYPGLLSFGYGLPVGYDFASGYGSDYEQGDLGGGSGGAPAEEYGPTAPDPQLAENAPPLYRPPYRGSQGSGEATVHPQPATTLIFKDGRPQEQVHNYALTGTTLWNLDGDTGQEIPLEAIDVPATVKVNRDAGVDFALPASR